MGTAVRKGDDQELDAIAAQLPDGYEVIRGFRGDFSAYDGGISRPRRGGVSGGTADELLAAVAYQRSLVHDMACCPKAAFRGCVCYVSFTCPDHGARCHGTHD
jgi:hypothetical protein